MIGSAHTFVKEGSKKLQEIYGILNPDMLASETSSEEELVFNRCLMPLFQALMPHYSMDKIDDIIEVLQKRYLGFEYSFNKRYSGKNKIDHFCIDAPEGLHALKLKMNMEEIIEMANAGQLDTLNESLNAKRIKNISLREVLEDWNKYEKINGTEELDKRLISKGLREKELQRDNYMQEKIREVYSPEENKTMIAVVGAVHTLNSPANLTLFSKLKDLDPKVILMFKDIDFENL